MKEQNWKRKEYESWDEAFRGLSPIVRQQSVRVAAYTQALFVQACKLRFGMNNKDGEDRMKGHFADLSYKCGLYHQIGKALVPPEYQVLQRDFTEEELAVYKKYTSDGRILVANLQEKNARAKIRRKAKLSEEQPTQNIPWLMIREAAQQHMERWDGSGYPEGRLGSDISPIGQIVGLAKELDRLSSETKSETPFELAFEELVAGSGSAWAPELIDVLRAAKDACFTVYNKYIAYTRTIPKTIPLVDKRPDRIMGLSYRPMMSDDNGSVTMYEATPWFGGVANQPDEKESADELRALFGRTKLTEDLSWYFLYEAADAVYRISNCKLEVEGILLNMLPDFYSLGTQLQRFNQLFTDEPIEKSKLLLTLPEEVLISGTKAEQEIVERYIRGGVCLVVDNYHPSELPPERLLEMNISAVRIAPELYLKSEAADQIRRLRKMGITVYGCKADTPESLSWLFACGAAAASGTMTGLSVGEDEMILDSLSREES